MSLEQKSEELKSLVAKFDSQWFVGNLSFLMTAIPEKRAQDQLGKLSSPLRQLYFLAGLNITSQNQDNLESHYSNEEWQKIVGLLNEIEQEYSKIFFPKENEEITEEWKRVRTVAMPSFFSYFNQGPLNYEEQEIEWVQTLYTQLDGLIKNATGLVTNDFLLFYENLDTLHQNNFRSFTDNSKPRRENWKNYSRLEVGHTMPPEIGFTPSEDLMAMAHFMQDPGMIDRFYANELAVNGLSEDTVNIILKLLSCKRNKEDFIYYTSTRPSNPLYDKPIIDIGANLFQVIEVKQVIHAIQNILQQICCVDVPSTTKYIEKKGALLEAKIVDLFKSFFKSDFQIFESYYVDGCEQDILILWKKHAFIIEAKGYDINEPFRDPKKAFDRIKSDFKKSIGYGYKQTRRVEEKFINEVPLLITDKNGKIIETVDTSKYEGSFSIIVNLDSFGQIQNDLSVLLERSDEDVVFPWVVKLDDLEVFLLTLIKKKKGVKDFINFLLMREEMHGKLICGDELEICGGYLLGKLNLDIVLDQDTIVTIPDLVAIFDFQYNKGMGFKNEKYLAEKKSGKTVFW